MLCSTLRKALLTGISLTALAGVGFLMAPAAKADSAGTGNFSVNANVIQTCTVSGSLNFGDYSGAQKDATGSINITCSSPTAVEIGLDAGSGTCAAPVRAMSDGSNSLSYGLYRSAADRTAGTAWGCDVGQNTQSLNPTDGGDTVSVYGRIPAQFKPVGSYSQDVTITVTY